MNRVITVVLGASLVFAPSFVDGQSRSWTDKSGKHSIRGKMSQVLVVIEQPDGKSIQVDVSSLSDADQRFVGEFIVKRVSRPIAKVIPALPAISAEDAKIALRRAGVTVSNNDTLILVRGEIKPDTALEMVRSIPTVRELIFQSSGLSKKHLAHLGELPNVTSVSMLGEVMDDWLVHLKGLKNLKLLSITSKHLTDAGLVHLKGMKDLEDLRLNRTKITQTGIEELYKSLPKCVAKLN